ncbi:hypothetical protein [Streptomyces sp. TP-A0874]|uniref:hypothetical protein n=1 Tax=Streptomyces sp. TP-A0874 TaxID=549819 RepID=UPI001112D566|nr:hypothetical protein [Streptomyces sp. TP-A0874]
MTIRTVNGTTLIVHKTREFTQKQRTHGLTINDTHTFYVLAGKTPVLMHNGNCIHASVAYQGWTTKGAHIHIGKSEVRIFPSDKGGIGAEAIRLRSGTASPKEVQKVLDEIHSNPALRADIIAKATSARTSMNVGEFVMQSNRAA